MRILISIHLIWQVGMTFRTIRKLKGAIDMLNIFFKRCDFKFGMLDSFRKRICVICKYASWHMHRAT